MKQSRSNKERVDVLVVKQGLAESREKAQALILSGKILNGDELLDKPGHKINEQITLRMRGEPDRFVSRGAFKLLGAIEKFEIDLKNQTCLDIGASTGGFTQVCLEAGAGKVYALDVGHNQMHWKIRSDEKVKCIENVNIREADSSIIPEKVDFVCIDTSFISLKMVLPKAIQFMKEGAKLVALIKPQHEVGKNQVGKGGIVKDPELHAKVTQEITEFSQSIGLKACGLVESSIMGTTGNKEFLIYCILT